MSANETATLVNTCCENEVHGALSITGSDISAEDIPLVPEVIFDNTLDSPGLSRESQPLLGGLDVSYNSFPGMSMILILNDKFIVMFFR